MKNKYRDYSIFAWIIPCLILVFVGLLKSQNYYANASNERNIGISSIQNRPVVPGNEEEENNSGAEMHTSIDNDNTRSLHAEDYLFTGRIVGSRVRFRSAPNKTDSDIITELQEGACVNVLEEVSGWYKVSWQNQEGYIYASFVERQ